MKDYSDIINFLVLDYKIKNKRKKVFEVKFFEEEGSLIILMVSMYKYKEDKIQFNFFKFEDNKFYINVKKNPNIESLDFKFYTNYATAEDE